MSMSKVAHISNEVHARAKSYCDQHGLRMSEWVGRLIDTATSPAALKRAKATPAPLRKPQPVVSGNDGVSDAFTRPPFWARSDASDQ